MARKLRIEYPGAIYHMMNRGDQREDIFHDDKDRELFLTTLAEACTKADWQVQAWNHFHLVMESPKGNLVAGMKWFLGTYTARCNRRISCLATCSAGATSRWWWTRPVPATCGRSANRCI